jgi:chromosome segregation ATPase
MLVVALLGLLLMPSLTTASGRFSQTLSDAERRALCDRATRELVEARTLIAGLDERIGTLREELAAQKGKDELQVAKIESLEREIALLLEDKRKAAEQLANAERAVAVLTEDNQRVRAERDRANKRTLTWAAIGAGVGAVLTYLFTRDDGPIVVVP